ncbi:MAG: excinuclease ABC subunit UvrC [Defluviitaleaceae bacterium]|nr:excinuclease ABC subunit UvrC [Defluviitaleaceae bacterium]
MFNISEELKKLPEKSGVYLMKDENEIIIYVGKSVNLKSRVRQYFQESSQVTSVKTRYLAVHIKSFEYIVTETEVEALILENNLIKKNRPRYNILLKDDKTYPYIKITNEMFPKIVKTRKVVNDGGKYFGPYTSSFLMSETMELVNTIWPIRTSKKVLPRDIGKGRPCLNYHIGKCKAPCAGFISEEEYSIFIKEAIGFLEGKYDDLIKTFKVQMLEASEQLNFEKAANLRDKITSIKALTENQNVENTELIDQDVLALAILGEDALMQIFFIRSGKMIGRESIFLEGASGESREEILGSFLKQFYSDLSFIPKEILIEEELKEREIIEKWLSDLRGFKVNLVKPQRGDKKRLLDMAAKNAVLTIEQFAEELKRQNDRTKGAMKTLEKTLGLINLSRIEAYDISNIQGTDSVGSMVVFEEGRPKNNDYRKFKIQGVVGTNDYAMMAEVLYRRFERYLKEDEKWTTTPDIIFIDGGLGHVNIAKEVLKDLNLEIPIAGMVKDENHKTRGLIYGGKEIAIKGDLFKLITRIQDEVHRFAIEYHRKLKRHTTLKSVLEDIEGIGQTRRIELFKKFGDIENIKKASIEELLQTKSMNKKTAESVYEYFNK